MDIDSDYVVEHYIKTKKIRKPLINDESADLLGNFDDKKRKEIEKNPNFNLTTEEDPFASDSDSEDNSHDEDAVEDGDVDSIAAVVDDDGMELTQSPKDANTDANSKANKVKKKKKKETVEVVASNVGKASGDLSNEQITALMKGASKQNRFVLYVTNLNYDTSKERLSEFFQKVGEVKSVRIPKKRKTASAFVEMEDISGFKVRLRIRYCFSSFKFDFCVFFYFK